jgi:Domain of unknown function (DUF4336)
MRLRELAPDLWIADQPLRFFGLEVGARMTIVGLGGERLLLHSPITRSHELAEQVHRLGSPAILIAPNRFHHLYAGDWQAAHPDARLYAAPGVEAKRPDLTINGVLGDNPLPDWCEVLDQIPIRGFPLANEVVFFHRPSRTLLASDLAFNVGASSPALTRITFRLMGAYGRLSCTPLERMSIRDRAAFRHSLSRILSWPIARIVVAHGEVVEDDAHRALAEAYSWLLRG